MHATLGEWVWSIILGVAFLASVELAWQAWLDYRSTVRSGVNGLRRAVSIAALYNLIVPLLFLALLFAFAATSLFAEPTTPSLTTRGLLFRWGSIAVSLITVLIQVTGLQRRRSMMDYARRLEEGG